MAETPTRALACAAPWLLVIVTGMVVLWPVIDVMRLPAPVLLIGSEGPWGRRLSEAVTLWQDLHSSLQSMSIRISAVEMIRLRALRPDRLRPVAWAGGSCPGVVLIGRTGEAAP